MYQCARDHNAEIVLPPSILLELARSANVEASRRDLQAILSGPRTQLPTEAELTAADLVSEIHRTHPQWLLPDPDETPWRYLHRFWTVEVWRAARRDWETFSGHMRVAPTEDLNVVHETQVTNKALFAGSGMKASLPYFASAPAAAPLWVKAMWPEPPGLEVWRVEGWLMYTEVLREILNPRRPDGSIRTHADWLEVYVDAKVIGRQEREWTRFWFYEVSPERLPHDWLGFTAQRYQADAKVTRSSPIDAQHADYLVECDVFMTADRRYVNTLKDMARDAPFPFAEPVRLSGSDRSVLSEIQEHLTELAQRNSGPFESAS